MKSRRNVMIAGCAVVVALVGLALLSAQGAEAARRFGPRSLDGAYHFSVAEIRVETFPTAMTLYCNAYGIVEFDGAGRAEILAGSGWGWCRDQDGNPLPDDPVEPGCFDYTVDVDGGVILTELTDPPACEPRPPGERYTSHCQILNRGRLLLCDGTGGGGDVPEGRLLWTATAGKL